MPVSDSYRDYVIERLESLLPVRHKRMFGGVGIWSLEPPDLFFALIADDVLYFKVDDETKPDFTAQGMAQFMNMNYYALPESVLEDDDALSLWTERAMDVAMRAKRT